VREQLDPERRSTRGGNHPYNRPARDSPFSGPICAWAIPLPRVGACRRHPPVAPDGSARDARDGYGQDSAPGGGAGLDRRPVTMPTPRIGRRVHASRGVVPDARGGMAVRAAEESRAPGRDPAGLRHWITAERLIEAARD